MSGNARLEGGGGDNPTSSDAGTVYPDESNKVDSWDIVVFLELVGINEVGIDDS